MAHCKQALKRIRQSEKLKIIRKSVRNEIKTISKRLSELVASNDAASARALLVKAFSKLDKAAKNHVYHRNAVDRRKSKLACLVGTLGQSPPSQDAPAQS